MSKHSMSVDSSVPGPAIIAVGVDGKGPGDTALRFAADEARRTGAALLVVTSWLLEPPPASPFGLVWDASSPEDQRLAAVQVQEAAIRRVLGEHPDVPVTRRIVQGEAGRALVDAAGHARLLVVGTRSLGSFKAVLLGSVSRYCAHHAPCPVVVVPAGGASDSWTHLETSAAATH